MGDETQKKRSWRGRLLGRRNLNPTRVVVVGFLLVILLGTTGGKKKKKTTGAKKPDKTGKKPSGVQ